MKKLITITLSFLLSILIISGLFWSLEWLAEKKFDLFTYFHFYTFLFDFSHALSRLDIFIQVFLILVMALLHGMLIWAINLTHC